MNTTKEKFHILLNRFTSKCTFEEIYDKRNNAFDVLRFLLASLVIYTHSYTLLFKKSYGDVLFRITKGQLTAGTFSVYCFFIISGFLITQSIVSSKSYSDYLLKRILRIMPAFFISLSVSAFILCPIISHMNLKDYFFTNINNTYNPIKYVLSNITFNVSGYAWGIYNVFSTNPYPLSINGSMWTLKHEFACYLFLIVISCLSIIKHRKVYLLYSLGMLFLVILGYRFNFRLFNLSTFKLLRWADFEYFNIINLGFYFTIGSLIFVYKDKLYFSYKYILLSIIIILLSLFMINNSLKYALVFCLPYLVIATAVRIKFSKFSRYGDFSYGLYIYAFTIQQTLAHYFQNYLNLPSFFMISYSITLIFSILSWRYIEKPCLTLKSKINFKSFLSINTLKI